MEKEKKKIHSSPSFGEFIQFWRICVFFQFSFMDYAYCKGKQSLANISIQINKHVVLSSSLLDSIFIVHCIAQSKLSTSVGQIWRDWLGIERNALHIPRHAWSYRWACAKRKLIFHMNFHRLFFHSSGTKMTNKCL